MAKQQQAKHLTPTFNESCGTAKWESNSKQQTEVSAETATTPDQTKKKKKKQSKPQNRGRKQ